MGVPAAIPIGHEQVFGVHGAFLLPGVAVSAAEDFDRKQAGAGDVQARDKETGLRVWNVRVVDADPESRKGQAEVTVKILADVQPVPPAGVPGLPFIPVEFVNLTVVPYVDTQRSRPRLAWSYRATGMRAPSKPAQAAAGRGESGRAA